MPHTIEHTWDNRCALISDDAIKGVNSVNEEFLQRMRGSIRSFYNSSVIAREAFAKEALNDILTKLHKLLTWSTDKNGYMPAPEHAVVSYAENWLIRLFLEVADLGLPWIKPNVTANTDGEVVFEWWYGRRKLTIYIDDQCAEYVQVWGADIDAAISDGDAESTDVCRLLWIWLIS